MIRTRLDFEEVAQLDGDWRDNTAACPPQWRLEECAFLVCIRRCHLQYDSDADAAAFGAER